MTDFGADESFEKAVGKLKEIQGLTFQSVRYGR
jgi:hypothetical protein